jgi:phenylalanyl-tRNA synthetase beta chain
MRFCLSWLKEHLKTQAPLDQIIQALINLGLEVEEVIDQGAAYRGFKLGKIVKFEKHPQADRLNYCFIDIGESEVVPVVCGGSNVRCDMLVAFAPPGVTIPATGDILKVGVVRGVESRGMLCSLDELCLGTSQNHEIMDIQTTMPVGTSLDQILGLNDVTIDVSITPNRGDCFSVYGIARDLRAFGL